MMTRRIALYVGLPCVMAVAVTLAMGRRSISQAKQANLEVERLSAQLAERESHLDDAHIDFESLFGEIVGNLEHEFIPLDRSARMPLRRGQVICERIASQARHPIRRASAYCTLGHIHYHLHDLQQSIRAYHSAIESLPANITDEVTHVRAYASNHLVHALATLGRHSEAIRLCADLRAAIDAQANIGRFHDELGFTLHNEAVLLATTDNYSEALGAARRQVGLLQNLTESKPADAALSERVIDSKYLLAGLLWRQTSTRHEAFPLLREVQDAATALWLDARKRMQGGEALSSYGRYKSEANRAKRELAFAVEVLQSGSSIRQPSFWTRKNLFRGRRSIDTSVLLEDMRMPAEFEEQEAMVLKWSEREWQDQFIIKLARELVETVEIHLLVDDHEASAEAVAQLRRAEIPQENIRFHQVSANTMWIRDYGPLTVLGSEGFPIWIDYRHLRPDELNSNDLVTERLSRLTGHRVIRAPLRLEGGNLVTNGRGIMVCTKQLESDNEELGFASEQLRRRMRNLLGCSQLIVLDPLHGEGTGHIDWFLTFVSPSTVVVGEYESTSDPQNADILDRNTEKLRQVRSHGFALEVVRIPMPPRLPDVFGGTYTNVVFANGKLIVPTWQYAGSEANQRAIDLYKSLLPDWEVIGVDCTDMLSSAGAVRCATVNVPRAPATVNSTDDSGH